MEAKKTFLKRLEASKGFRYAVSAIILIIAVVFVAYAYFVPYACGKVDKEFLYCHVHDGFLSYAIGPFFVITGFAWFSYVLSPLIREYDTYWTFIIPMAAALVGFLIIYAC